MPPGRPGSKAMMYAESLLPKLEELARRAAEPMGVSVEWVEFKREGPRWFLRVFIDQEGGVSLRECERVSERLSVLLDVEDPIESSYTLEVSSPGLDRPLFTLDDYRRFAGRKATVQTKEPIEGRRRFTGRIVDVEADAVRLEGNGGRWRIPMKDIARGRLEVELEIGRRAPSGKPRKRS